MYKKLFLSLRKHCSCFFSAVLSMQSDAHSSWRVRDCRFRSRWLSVYLCIFKFVVGLCLLLNELLVPVGRACLRVSRTNSQTVSMLSAFMSWSSDSLSICVRLFGHLCVGWQQHTDTMSHGTISSVFPQLTEKNSLPCSWGLTGSATVRAEKTDFWPQCYW